MQRQAFALVAGGAEQEHPHVTGFGSKFADDAQFVAAEVEAGEVETAEGLLPLFFGTRSEALADFRQQLPPAGRIAAPLTSHETGLRLALGDNMRDKVVKQPLHARAGGARRAQQRLVP